MNKLQRELSMAPGSLAEEIWQEANDPECNPEIIWDCSVRVSDDICDEEKVFLEKRKLHTTKALAHYLDIPEDDVYPDDVPTIAMCGSGGGLRALVAGTASYLSTKNDGLFDCITYTAGVSGSCWLQTLFYSTIGQQDHDTLIRHLKNRLGVHIAYPPAALSLVNSAPTNKFLLSGLVEKVKGVPDADFGIVDIYGILLAARLLVPKGELHVDEDDLKLSKQSRYIEHGKNPLPIYTAVRHEIPFSQQDAKDLASAAYEARKEAWFQWFEFTPYEFWCEEFGAGIPTWAIGRKFDGGRSLWRENGLGLPELRIPLLMAIWGSAFCATLSHYYKEVRPAMKALKGFAGIDQMISDHDEDLVKVHPIDPATIPNFALGMRDSLPSSCPESVFEISHLQLMDAGMSNNLPIYPLLRPGRDIDILIAFDASADVKADNWLRVADGYARQRGINGWPVGAGWPSADESREQTIAELEEAQAKSELEARDKIAKAVMETKKEEELGYCNVWVGTTEERSIDEEPPPSKLVEEDWELMQPSAGITVIYFPFLANPKVEGVNPKTSDFLSTWNFVYTPEQIDKVIALASANFDEGKEQTRRAVRAVYERKKEMRLGRERKEKALRKQRKMRLGRLGKKLGEGDHANQFS
jgi:phospholipase A2